MIKGQASVKNSIYRIVNNLTSMCFTAVKTQWKVQQKATRFWKDFTTDKTGKWLSKLGDAYLWSPWNPAEIPSNGLIWCKISQLIDDTWIKDHTHPSIKKKSPIIEKEEKEPNVILLKYSLATQL